MREVTDTRARSREELEGTHFSEINTVFCTCMHNVRRIWCLGLYVLCVGCKCTRPSRSHSARVSSQVVADVPIEPPQVPQPEELLPEPITSAEPPTLEPTVEVPPPAFSPPSEPAKTLELFEDDQPSHEDQASGLRPVCAHCVSCKVDIISCSKMRREIHSSSPSL